ncbi:hypothetical protein [Microbacterium amylolyticum]|uniref:Exo-alpha-sialidase n=1 Tax=Microbacterium amylolyticum TaxID=936337 RepID=A0ABS4ZIW3_9MICO|nr:hypothetical protein [Microbacterium amylolyticum]MBP2437211.1 hypothetical protein [Microbacterium amylolyticum]
MTNTFQDPHYGEATSVDAASLAPDTFVRTGRAGDGSIIAAVSSDAGQTWTASPAAVGASGSGTITVNADASAVTWAPVGAAPLRSADRVRFGAVPGAAGHLWLAGGDDDEEPYGMWRSTDAGSTWPSVSGFDEADSVGFGKATPGASSPAIYTAAKYEGVRGVFRSIDDGTSWTRINDDNNQWGWIGAAIEGDPDEFGRVYIVIGVALSFLHRGPVVSRPNA